MSDSDGHGDFERGDADGRADYSGTRMQQGRVPLDEDVNHERDVRHRERAVSAADYEPLAPQGFAEVGRVGVAAVFGVAALALGALLLSQIQGPREDGSLGLESKQETQEPDKLQREHKLGPGFDAGEVLLDDGYESEYELQAEDSTTMPVSPTPSPIEINFNADQYVIERGQCTTLRWVVTGADTITLLGVERESTAAQEVCPDETTGYTLTAENASDAVSEYFEITLIEPVDNSPGCTPEPNDPCPN